MAASGFELARLWSEAPALLPHGAGCSCAGHVAMHVDPQAVETDILDYLEQRYKKDGLSELAGFIANRRAARGITFTSWLMSLDVAPMAVEARARLLGDLGATLSSLARQGDGHR